MARQRGRLHYYAVVLQVEGGEMCRFRVVASDPVEAIKVGEELHNNRKNAKRVLNSSAVQQLDPLFEPVSTVN